jgi:hypothetical protein
VKIENLVVELSLPSKQENLVLMRKGIVASQSVLGVFSPITLAKILIDTLLPNKPYMLKKKIWAHPGQ